MGYDDSSNLLADPHSASKSAATKAVHLSKALSTRDQNKGVRAATAARERSKILSMLRTMSVPNFVPTCSFLVTIR